MTTSDGGFEPESFVTGLQALDLDARITGIMRTVNDREADAVIPERTELLNGTPEIHDSILGLDFEISPFSFFQVNTSGAEALYSAVRILPEMKNAERFTTCTAERARSHSCFRKSR